MKQIADQRLMTTELNVGSKPLSQNFRQRNRIISVLSLAIIVIEAGLKSSSLIIANFVLEQIRDV